MLDKLLADLRSDEGWRESPYRYSLDFLTIGYGFLIDERKSVKLPRAVGDLWLELVARDKWSDLLGRLPWLSEQPEDVQRALANMAYQMGVGGVLGFRTMLAALTANDRVRAAEAALDSTWARQTSARALRVAALLRGLPT
jgi:lysozyme